jgi:hypothetical protein
MRVLNIHQRWLPGPPERAGALLDELAGPGDRLWPHDRWPAMRFDRPLGPGAEGGHGPIRYRVEVHEPGRMAAFRFTGMRGIEGSHRLEVEPAGPGAVVVRHVTEAQIGGRLLVVWPLVIRPLHNALLEDLLDRAELAVTGTVASPARWSPYVRLLRGRLRRRGTQAAVLGGRGSPAAAARR